jgi:hypothetical protein
MTAINLSNYKNTGQIKSNANKGIVKLTDRSKEYSFSYRAMPSHPSVPSLTEIKYRSNKSVYNAVVCNLFS